MYFKILILSGLLFCQLGLASQQTQQEFNKILALQFYQATHQLQNTALAKKYLAQNFVHHHLSPRKKEDSTKASYVIKDILAENNLVTIHLVSTPKKKPPHREIEIFRFEKGNISEQWSWQAL